MIGLVWLIPLMVEALAERSTEEVTCPKGITCAPSMVGCVGA